MDQSIFIKQVTDTIARLGLLTPAVLLLEGSKPLAFIGSQFLLAAQPALDIFLTPGMTGQTIDLLADETQLEHLIASLETRAKES
jgi:hypothetical protein